MIAQMKAKLDQLPLTKCAEVESWVFMAAGPEKFPYSHKVRAELVW
jgi:hypothetical protein